MGCRDRSLSTGDLGTVAAVHEAASRALFAQEVDSLTPDLAGRRRWLLNGVHYPVLDCTFSGFEQEPLRVRLTCDDWNTQPPRMDLLDASGEFLLELPNGTINVFNRSKHPDTGRPFVCMRGSREYHTHPSHRSDMWEQLRSDPAYSLPGLLFQLWQAWRKGWTS